MNRKRPRLSRALKSDVGRQMFTSVPRLVLFISAILFIQSLFFYFNEYGATGKTTPIHLSLFSSLGCLPVFFYLRKNPVFNRFSLLNFLVLFSFFSLELYILVILQIRYIWSMLLLVQVLGGYFLLSNTFFYVLTGLNLFIYAFYIAVYIASQEILNYEFESALAFFAAILLSFLIQKDRRKSLINLDGIYGSQRDINDMFTQLEENIDQIFILCSSDFKQVFHISPAFERVLMISSKDLMEHPLIWMDYIHKGDRLRVDLELDIARKEHSHRDFDFRFTDRNLESWLRFQIFPIDSKRNGEVDRFAVIVDNITESKVAELKLAEARSLDGEMAARIQRNFFFSDSDLNMKGLDVSAHSIPSLDVGGDYYDLYKFSPSIVDIIIADVMGKGMIASMLGAASKSAFMKSRLDLSVELNRIPPIKRIVSETNRIISGELIQMGKFITLQYARIDMNREIFSFIDNGHTSILHYSARLKCCWSLKGWNMPLGFNPEEEVISSIIPFEEGDLFYLYSDGIIEAENGEGEQFGEKRLTYIINNSSHLTSNQIINKIRNLVFHYSSAESYADDVTSIAVKTSELKRESYLTDAVFEGRRESLQVVRTFVSAFLLDRFPFLDPDLHNVLVLAVNEAVANIIEHNYEKDPLKEGREILLEAGEKGDFCYFTLYWDGEEFDWSVIQAPELREMKSGGYGLSLMKEIMDSVSYSSNLDGVQRLCLVREIKGP